MDRNSIIGLFIIAGILIGWMVFNAPSKEELARQKQIQDSVKLVQQKAEKAKADAAKLNSVAVNADNIDTAVVLTDSALSAFKKQVYGDFINTAEGKDTTIALENKVMKLNIAAKGGRIQSVELKNYKRFDGKPLVLFNADSSTQNITFAAYSKTFSTDSLYFAPVGTSNSTSKSLAMRLYAGSTGKYIEYVYTLKDDEYMMDFDVNMVGMQHIISSNVQDVTLNWSMKTPMQEKNKETQAAASTIYYKNVDENVDKISEGEEEKLALQPNVKWIGLKQQFFTSVIIADSTFKNANVETKMAAGSNKFVKEFSTALSIPYTHAPSEKFGMQLYFGPNHFKTLKKYDLDLEKQINLGWKIFGWINRLLTIPIFNFLSNLNLNFGIIILILTLIIKVLLLPIAYKTVLSSAKMRVLKPEIDELNEKFKDQDPIKKQQATMALYNQAGVNPMAGCVPVLLQMPILIALFSFFPASIELRQQGFLWANDLSTYDSVYNFGFSIPWYGDHVSLFALLMTASTLLYTWSNSQLMGSSNQMPGMQWMMYLMPILFLGFLNNYSAGLSWYYFLANMFTFGQTWIMQNYVIDSKALHAKIQENKKKPVKVSKFQQRLEQMTKERQQQIPAKKK
jgi:YidC/Oxa1 family membrane protein insertase